VWCEMPAHKFAGDFLVTSGPRSLQLGECDACCYQVISLPPQTHWHGKWEHSDTQLLPRLVREMQQALSYCYLYPQGCKFWNHLFGK